MFKLLVCTINYLTLSVPNFRRQMSSAFFFFFNKLSLGIHITSFQYELKDGMSNSLDPDETAHSRLLWIYAVCKVCY